MMHGNSQRLLDEWRRQQPADGRLPRRAAMSPMGFGPLLSQLVILGCGHGPRADIRLAGGAVTGLHGRDLRDTDFLALWRRDDRSSLHGRMEASRRLAQPMLIHAHAETALGGRLQLEIILAPLEGPAGQADRMIGLYQILGAAPVIAGRPVSQFTLESAVLVAAPMAAPSPPPGGRHPADAPRRLRLVVDNGRRVA